MLLTGNKDIDRKILNKLEDKDLVKVCQVNKNANSICNDQVFWMNRVFNRFGYVGGDMLRQYKKDRSWSEYYIQDLRKINKNTADKYLIETSQKGRLDQVMISLEKGADVHADDDEALRWASGNGHLEVVRLLLEKGADVHARALQWASQRGHLEVVRLLKEYS